jgi:hypothetical protein
MKTSLLKFSLLLLYTVFLSPVLRAETKSITLAGLPNFGSVNAPQARVDTLSVTLDPVSNAIHGRPGETVGWGFKFSWSSNAGDHIAFSRSTLSGDTSVISTSGYHDLMFSRGGNTEGRVVPGVDWEVPFSLNPSPDGAGYLTIPADTIPGSGYLGELRLYFKVYDTTSVPAKFMMEQYVDLDVSVEVAPVDRAAQTITFAPIGTKSTLVGTFTLSPTTSSGLPVVLTSLNPNVCAVEENTVTIVSDGNCTIIATQPGNPFFYAAPPMQQTFKVEKSNATVTIIGSLDRNYTGTDHAFTATTVPPGLPVSFRYNGDTPSPRDPGIYFVQAFIEDPSYTGSETATLIITDVTPPPFTTYAGWLQSHFTTAEIQAGTLTGLLANPAGDEFNNLFKYALDFDPLTPLTPTDRDTLLRMAGSAAGNSVVVDLPLTAAADVTIAIEASSSLAPGQWQEIARRASGSSTWTGTADVFTGTPNASGTRVPILVTEPTPAGTRRFYRLNFIRTP